MDVRLQSLGLTVELSEREDAITQALETRGVTETWEVAPIFAQAGLADAELDAMCDGVPDGALPQVSSWLGASLEVRQLLGDMRSTRANISELMGAFKAYTFMDQGDVHDIDVHERLGGTFAVLQHRIGGMTIVRDFAESLPPIVGSGSELNQVWTNLVDNAIDATKAEGTTRDACRRRKRSRGDRERRGRFFRGGRV
jgi:signal transduction histidine kinase